MPGVRPLTDLQERILGVVRSVDGAIGTTAICRDLGPYVPVRPPLCGHNGCTDPAHIDSTPVWCDHPSDMVRPALHGLARRGLVERIYRPKGQGNPTGQFYWRARIPPTKGEVVAMVDELAEMASGLAHD